jgi:cyclophilin family peptidyl-prolyl cis-trans isomerase
MLIATVSVVFILIVSYPDYFADEDVHPSRSSSHPELQKQLEDTAVNVRGSKDSNSKIDASSKSFVCPYKKLSDLSESERYPKASATRHVIDPPNDTKIDLVCCETTQGPWNIAVHHSWAPIGAAQFMDMVRANHFSSPKVPLMRCISNFLCQFGLNGASGKKFGKLLTDDPQWLPAGPDHRINELNVKRFQRGYFSYAGGGENSRSNQIFVALADSGMLGGGSPWEVPWGELVGTHSYETLDKIYTGYGEKGPGQGMLHHDNAIETTEREFPLISWVLGCQIVDEL